MLANALVLHGGGPTAVLNASLAGIVEAARGQPRIRSLYGAPHGADGLLQDSLIELTAFPPGIWQEISTTPGSVIGSSRKNLSEADFSQTSHPGNYFYFRKIIIVNRVTTRKPEP